MEFNATSLLPQNNFLGMRLDVVDSLADLKFQGPLRYPGGCYAPFYRWKDGLLPLLARPTSFTPPNYCLAVAGGVNAYSDGFMQNGPGIDEYMALVSRIGATPAITVPLQFGSEKEITDARDWVEYCNGDSSDPKNVWAALRAARGHPEPYNVKMWYLGNEIAWQLRFPDYPASLNQSGGMTGVEYQRALESLIPALLAVDPSLVLLVVSSDERFNAPWLNSDVTPNISAPALISHMKIPMLVGPPPLLLLPLRKLSSPTLPCSHSSRAHGKCLTQALEKVLMYAFLWMSGV